MVLEREIVSLISKRVMKLSWATQDAKVSSSNECNMTMYSSIAKEYNGPVMYVWHISESNRINNLSLHVHIHI